MKANELRIGNWLRDNQGDFKVKALEEGVEFADIAIPLTPEWLVMAGFKKQNNAWCCPNKECDFSLFAYDGEPYVYNSADCYPTVLYVHQLQNLYFALTGEELIFIKLPKP